MLLLIRPQLDLSTNWFVPNLVCPQLGLPPNPLKGAVAALMVSVMTSNAPS